jgi:CRISPR-associated protein Csb2
MALSVEVRLRHGRYDAGGARPDEPEWPPHPARVFCALVASADGPLDWDALRWLESAGSPEVWTPPGPARAGRVNSYVVTNATEQKGGSQFWPGRTNGFRSRSFVTPGCDRFAIVWPSAGPAPEILAALGRLARRVPYVGRSTSAAEVTVSDALPDGRMPWSRLVPTGLGDPAVAGELRVPYQGYADALRHAYDEGVPAHQMSRPPVAYAEPTPEPAPPAAPDAGPWEDLIVWGWQQPAGPVSGDQAVRVTAAFRKAVLSLVADPIPAQVSGHGADGQAHAGFFALPDVGHEHADGHLLGLALAIPRDLPSEEWKQLVRGVAGGRLTAVRVWRDRDLRLTSETRLRGLRPDTWTAAPGGARDWVTATPLMCDGRLRERRTLADLVRRSLRKAGFPDPGPDGVEVSPAPLIAGAIWRPRAGTLPKDRPRWPLTHARVRFPQPVTGPVAAGALRYLGLGLFLPDRGAR